MLIFLFLCSLIMCYLIFLLSMIFESNETSKFQPHKYGLAIGWAEAKGWVLHPYLCPAPTSNSFVLPCLHLALRAGKNFLAPSLPLGASWSPVPPHKTLLFVDLTTTITNFFNKTCFIYKHILEITNKFIPSN